MENLSIFRGQENGNTLQRSSFYQFRRIWVRNRKLNTAMWALFTAPVSGGVSCGSLSRRVVTSGKEGRDGGYDVTLLRLAV